MKKTFTIGLDYGSNSVRGIAVDASTGNELASFVFNYPSGEKGILLDKKNHHLARQNPADYIVGMEKVLGSLFAALKKKKFPLDGLAGIGIDTTGSTPIPVDKKARALGLDPRFKKNLNAQAWLWKDHTGVKEAAEITALAAKMRPAYIAKCGNTYSSEWFWSKILHCLSVDPKVFDAAESWVECCDYIPAVLCGVDDPKKIRRSICAAGHKALFHTSWGGLPEKEFLAALDPKLASLRDRLFDKAHASDMPAGEVSPFYLKKFGLGNRKIPVAVGAFDAHFGAVGSGVKEGTLVKIIGTSTCDITVGGSRTSDIPGVCGVVPGSVVPGLIGVEAGQSAVGDILNWFVEKVCREKDAYHGILTKEAAALKPGQSGLLALDWNNGNRTILVDAELTGLLVGQTLHSTRAEIYRALIEATAFGARRIIERMSEYGVRIEEVVNCGGISQKNPLFMQIYADVIGKPMVIAPSLQTCALGSAIFASVVGGIYEDAGEAQKKMLAAPKKIYRPIPKNRETYEKLYRLYLSLHDGFGVRGSAGDLTSVMKTLLEIKKSAV